MHKCALTHVPTHTHTTKEITCASAFAPGLQITILAVVQINVVDGTTQEK